MNIQDISFIANDRFIVERNAIPKPRGLFGTWQRVAAEDDISPQNQRI